MVVTVILDTEYMGVESRSKWFLKAVSNAMKEDTVIVTHSYFKNHLNHVVKSCSERFYDEFEMDYVSAEQIEKLDICYIPDELFDAEYEKNGTRGKQLIYLYNERCTPIEEYIIEYLDAALRRRDETRPSCIYNCLHTFKSIKHIAHYYNTPLIPYVFTAIRKVHGYAQTLYMAHLDDDLFNSDACKRLYTEKEVDLGFPLFEKKEILALIGKRHNMPLLPLVNSEGKYDLGVIGPGYHIIPEVYLNDAVTDDDLYYEGRKYYPEESIVTRLHPIQLDQIGIGREHMKNDPAAFILSCKRMVTVQSQMIIKAAMWNRTAVAMSDALPYAFLLNSKLNENNKVSDYNMNFIIFVYFVPESCMFDSDYWKWRESNPSIKEIALRHIETIISSMDVSIDDIKVKNDRLERILKGRCLNEQELLNAVRKDLTNVSYEYPTSCIKYKMIDKEWVTTYAVNEADGGVLKTSMDIPKGAEKIVFIPQNDVDGYIILKSVSVSSKELFQNVPEKYYKKNEIVLECDINKGENSEFKAVWAIRKY